MKLYQITDGFQGKRRYEGTLGKANWVASLWATELEKFKGLSDVEVWIDVRELKGKAEIINALNINAPL